MSRFNWDGEGGGDYPQNASDLYEARAATAIYSRRGRASLRELREALLALPRHELISGAFSRGPKPDDEDYEPPQKDPNAIPIAPGQMRLDGTEVEWPEILTASPSPEGDIASRDYGVCAVAALVWHKKVKAGMATLEAFASLPRWDADEDEAGDEMFSTAAEGQRAGLTYTLAWELESGNDETFDKATPPERWQKMMDWIDKVLASPPLRRGEKPRDRLGRSWTW